LASVFSAGIIAAAEPRPIEAFDDNSFFLAEAYNQERGDVQHAFKAVYANDSRRRGWSFNFEQEWWLFSQDHQIAFSIPFFHLREEGERQRGIGDVQLGYRYQLLDETEQIPAVAPGFSLVFPTGDRDEGTGYGVVGYEWGLAASKKLGQRLAVHANLGLTYLPDARARLDDGSLSPRRSLVSYKLAASTVFALSPAVHLLLEWLGESEAEINDNGKKERDFKTVLSPGIRTALINQGSLQTVLGLGIPIGLNRAADNYGVFLYLSVQHRIF
jgi:hypothetical protein